MMQRPRIVTLIMVLALTGIGLSVSALGIQVASAPITMGDEAAWSKISPSATLDSPASIFGGEENWSGATDYKVILKMAYDNIYLYFRVEVTDDRITNIAPVAQLFSGDSIIFGVNRWVLTYGARSTNNSFITIFGGNVPVALAGLVSSVTVNANSYVVEGKVPLTSLGILPVPGSFADVDLVAYDNDRNPDQTGVDTTMGLGPDSPWMYADAATWQKAMLSEPGGNPKMIFSASEFNSLVNGTKVRLMLWPVAVSVPTERSIYIGDAQRKVGLKVNLPDGPVVPEKGWMIRSLIGFYTIRDGIRQIDAILIDAAEGNFLTAEPVMINLKSLGGAASGPLPFSGMGFGANNCGLYVRVIGRVTGHMTGGFRLDGCCVYSSTSPHPVTGSVVSLNGISIRDKSDASKMAIEAGDSVITIIQEVAQ